MVSVTDHTKTKGVIVIGGVSVMTARVIVVMIGSFITAAVTWLQTQNQLGC